MKFRIAMITALSLFVASASYAGFGSDLGGAVGGSKTKQVMKAGEDVAAGAAINDLNKQLSALSCKFNNSVTESETNCNFSKIAQTINKYRTPIEKGLGKKVYIKVTAYGPSKLRHRRANNVEDRLEAQTGMNWWRISRTGITSESNNSISFRASK